MLKSTTAQAHSLAGMYGPDRAAHMPGTLYCHVFTADPDEGGVEVTTDAPPSLPSDDFPSLADLLAVDGELETPDFVWISSDAWPEPVTYAELRDGDGVRYDGGPLDGAVNVTQAGTEVTLNARIFYNELGE